MSPRGPQFSGGPPTDDDRDEIVEPSHGMQRRPMGPPVHAIPMDVTPVRRPDLLAAIKRWHNGIRDRSTGQVIPWATLRLVHLDTGRTVMPFDLRPDEDDIALAIEIESALDAHGKPLAQHHGIAQAYQLDAYFGDRVDPQSNWIGSVEPTASLDAFGPNQNFMRQRGTPQDFQQQGFRRNEMEINAQYGMMRFNMQYTAELLMKERTENDRLRGLIKQVEDQKRELENEEHKRKLEMMREAAKIRRMNFVVAKAARYLPIIASRLDEKMFGLTQLTPEEKEAKTNRIVTMLLDKLKDGPEGEVKFQQLVSVLNLSESEVKEIHDVGVMTWLEKQRRDMAREAEVAQKGGFAGLGKDVQQLMNQSDGLDDLLNPHQPKQIK